MTHEVALSWNFCSERTYSSTGCFTFPSDATLIPFISIFDITRLETQAPFKRANSPSLNFLLLSLHTTGLHCLTSGASVFFHENIDIPISSSCTASGTFIICFHTQCFNNRRHYNHNEWVQQIKHNHTQRAPGDPFLIVVMAWLWDHPVDTTISISFSQPKTARTATATASTRTSRTRRWAASTRTRRTNWS